MDLLTALANAIDNARADREAAEDDKRMFYCDYHEFVHADANHISAVCKGRWVAKRP